MSLTSLLPILVIAAIVAIVAKGGGSPWRKLRVDPGQADTVVAASVRVQARSLLTFGTGATVLIVLVSIGFSFASADLGRIVVAAPTLAAAAAVLVIAIAPTAVLRESATARVADLTQRKPWDFGAKWMFVLAAGSALVLLGVLVALGLSGGPDGRSVTRVTELTSTSAGPYPGFFYGVPLAIAVLALAGVTLLALARIAAAPRPTAASLREADEVIRQVSTRVVLKIVSASTLGTCGVILVMASAPTRSVGDAVTAGGEKLRDAIPGMEALAIAELNVGVVLAAAGVGLLLWAVRDAARTPLALEREVVLA